MFSFWDPGVSKEQVVIGFDGCRRVCSQAPYLAGFEHAQGITPLEHWSTVVNRDMGGADGCGGFSSIAALRQEQSSSETSYRDGNDADTGAFEALHRCTLL